MDDPGAAPKVTREARTPLWLRLVLVASLGLNLLVVGIVGGVLFAGGGSGPPREAARDLGSNPFVRALPPEDRRALVRDAVRDRGAWRENRETMRARFEALLGILRAETLDEAALAAVLSEQRDAGLARQKLGEGLIVARVSAMSAEERRAYADRLEAAVRRPQRR